MKYTSVTSDNLSRLFLLLAYLKILPTEKYFYFFEKKEKRKLYESEHNIDKSIMSKTRKFFLRIYLSLSVHIFSMFVSGYRKCHREERVHRVRMLFFNWLIIIRVFRVRFDYLVA